MLLIMTITLVSVRYIGTVFFGTAQQMGQVSAESARDLAC